MGEGGGGCLQKVDPHRHPPLSPTGSEGWVLLPGADGSDIGGTNGSGIGGTNVGIGGTNVGIGGTNVGISGTNVGIGGTNVGIGGTDVGICSTDVGICGTDVGICGTDGCGIGGASVDIGSPDIGSSHVSGVRDTGSSIVGDIRCLCVASVAPILPGWLDCQTAIPRVRVQHGLSQRRFSVLTQWDRFGTYTAGTVPARAHLTLPDNCSQGCGSRLVFTRVIFGGPDRCDQFRQ